MNEGREEKMGMEREREEGRKEEAERSLCSVRKSIEAD